MVLKISKVYGFNDSKIGEIWGVNAHKSYSNKIANGIYTNMSFRDLYDTHKEYFSYYPKKEFPLLSKIIDSGDDLSVQVHPDVKYSLMHENTYGKDDC